MALTPYSWKIVTTANCTFAMPFECAPVGIWCDTPGVAKTATIEGIWGGGVLPTDAEIWLETEFLGSGASPQASFVADCTADLLATPANQTASGATWGWPSFATFDPATVANVTLSGGNLVATNTGTTSADQGARVDSAGGKTSGKYYFEVIWTTITGSSAGNHGVGVGTTASTYTVMGNNATGGIETYRSGSAFVNGSTASVSIGGVRVAGDVIGIAVDLNNRTGWFKRVTGTPPSSWNGSAPADPATNIGGFIIPAGTIVPIITFGGSGSLAGNVMTANFGASAFTGLVPAGFTSGWTLSATPFKLSTTFTPAQRGFIYCRVKCARPSSTFYIDPRVTLS